MSPPDAEHWIDIDLSDLNLRAPLTTLDDLATAAAHVYERFVPHADQGWEWIGPLGRPEFDCWSYQLHDGQLIVSAARLPVRRAAGTRSMDTPDLNSTDRVSPYRTGQLTQRPWTGEPGSKIWKPLPRAPESGAAQEGGLH